MAIKFVALSCLLLFFCCKSIKGDPGRDLCKIVIQGTGLKCSKMSSYFFPYDTFLSFNDDVAQFTNDMKYLEIKNSNISVLQGRSFQRTPFLSQIVLSRICLLEVQPGAFEGLKRVKLVDLSHNLLTSVPVDAFKYTKVNRVNLEGNVLLEIPTNGPVLDASFLTSLSLKNCNIQHLSGSAFQLNPILEHLDLSQNFLRELPLEIFSSLEHLSFVDLSGNKFQTLDVQTFEKVPSFPKHPKFVIMSENPWVCDCKLSKMADWLTKNVKTGLWSDKPQECRLRKLVECKNPNKISWNSIQFKELMSSC